MKILEREWFGFQLSSSIVCRYFVKNAGIIEHAQEYEMDLNSMDNNFRINKLDFLYYTCLEYACKSHTPRESRKEKG